MRSPRIHLAHRQEARTQAKLLYLENPSEEAIAARHSFEAFRWFVKKHKTYVHHRSWEPYLNTGDDSRCLNAIAGNDLLLLAPRGSSKSTFLIEWVAWQIGRHASPEIGQALKILYVSYELKTARQKSQQVKRLLMLPEYKKVFPWIKPGENWANELWEIDFNHAGLPAAEEPYTLAAAGLIGNLTGKRCFPGDILIETEIGQVPISEIHRYLSIRILTFNEYKRSLEWCQLKKSESRPSDEILEIRTSGGCCLRCTPDHLVYTINRGYTEAQYLLQGDTLVISPQGKEKISRMLGVQQGNDSNICQNLRGLLSGGSETRFQCSMQGMSTVVSNGIIGVTKKSHHRDKRLFLQPQMPWIAQPEAKTVCKLRHSDWGKSDEQSRSPLFGLLNFVTKESENCPFCHLSYLRKCISPSKSSSQVLFPSLFKQGSLCQNDRKRKQSLQGRRQLREAVYGLEGTCALSRQSSMSCLFDPRKNREKGQVGKSIEFSDSSFQSRSYGQQNGELGDSLQGVSYNSSYVDIEWAPDTVSLVVRLPRKNQLVYDLEIEGNHNFFANGVLVHNCHLSVFDDLIKSPESIANPDIREQMVSNYRNIIKPTRFDGGRSVCLGTRMRPDDIYCTEFIPENDWDVIEQSAIITHPDGSEESYWEPEDDNSPGQTLVFLQNIREKEPETFSYQYQNKVIPIKTQAIAPGLITRGLIPNKMEILVLGVDLSAGVKEKNDFTAFSLGGMAFNDRRHPHYYTIDCWEGRTMGNMAKLEAIEDLYNCWKHLCKYMEIWVESNGYQLSFAGDYQDYVAEKGLYDWRVHPVPSTRDKLQRLRGVTGILENGCHTFNTYGRLIGKLTLQLTQWGSTGHDDLGDSWEKMLSGLRARHPLTGASYG